MAKCESVVEKENKSLLEKIADVITQRGHAAMFARDNKLITKELIEKTVAAEWANSMREKFHIEISDVQHANAAHPDCFAYYCGERMNLELTELVKGNILAKYSGLKGHTPTQTRSSYFDEAQWSFEEFATKIEEMLTTKDEKYFNADMKIDALIIYTDEDWLPPQTIQEWLEKISVAPRNNVRNAYLLRTYFPGYGSCWPVFRLYGTL